MSFNVVRSENFKHTWYIFRGSGVEVSVVFDYSKNKLDSELPLSIEEREYFEKEIIKKPLRNLWMKH